MNYNYDEIDQFTPYGRISSRVYNLIFGGCVCWGLLANYLICCFFTDAVLSMNPLILIAGYVIFAFAGIMMSKYSTNPYISFIGYNLVVIPIGLVLSLTLESYGGVDSYIVQEAFLCTLIIVFIMCGAAFLFPYKFVGIGPVLFSGLIGVIIARAGCYFFGFGENIICWISAIIFSFYIGYDMVQAFSKERTADNAVDSAVDLYLDIINLFIHLLAILGNNSDSRGRRGR